MVCNVKYYENFEKEQKLRLYIKLNYKNECKIDVINYFV